MSITVILAKTDDMNLSRLLNTAALLAAFWAGGGTPVTFAQCALPNGIIFVENTLDEGPGSLREAIDCANSTPGPNTIRFNIVSLDDQIFMVGSTTMEPLPALTDDETIIDGSTQAGFGLNGDFTPRIILDGSAVDWDLPVNGLTILCDGFGIYGLEIRNFPYNGIEIRNGDDGRVGDPQRMNIIYSNGEERDIYPLAPVTGMYEGSGIFMRSSSTNVTIENNIIGSDETLVPGLGNEWAGIRTQFNSFNNFIGRNTDGRRNTILHNPTGVLVIGSGGQRISGNIFLCNDTAAISMLQNSNSNKPAPMITAALTTGISGSAQNGSTVEVYLSVADSCPAAVCQGSVYLGVAEVAGGIWHLPAPFANGTTLSGGETVTALAVDLSPISSNSSPFSSCRTVIDPNVCANSQGDIMVTHSADGGIGSLRYAIGCANAVPGPNTILFSIPENQLTPIFVGETTGDPLPTLTDGATTIDGTSQTGGAPVLDGSLTNWDIPYNALFIQGDSCAVYGLEIRNFPDDAIDITNAGSVIIGRPGGGNVIHGNGSEQDEFDGLPGSGPWEGSGIVLKGTTHSCLIQANTLGLTSSGLPSPNEFAGIRIRQSAAGHIIGEANPEAQNRIAGQPFGISIEGTAQNIDIQPNSFECNTEEGVLLMEGANGDALPPTIDSARIFSFSGTIATGGERIDLYVQPDHCVQNVCQGQLYIGSGVISGQTWQLDSLVSPIPPGPINVTATSTDGDGNTSGFAPCIQYTRDCDSFSAPAITVLDDTCFAGIGSIFIDPADPQVQTTLIYELRRTGGNPPIPSDSPLEAGTYRAILADWQGCADTLLVEVLNIDGLPEADFNQDQQGLSIFLTNTSQQSDSLVWSFGDGATSNINNPVHTYSTAGIYEVCLTAFGACGDNTTCQTVFVLPEDQSPTFTAGFVNGEAGDTVSVPIITSGFSDIIGLQFSIGPAAPTLGTIIGVGNFQLPGLSQSSFILSPENAALSWFDFGLSGVSVPDQTVLFDLTLVLSTQFSGCLPIQFLEDPTPPEVILIFDGQDVRAPFILQDGEICEPGSAAGLISTSTGLPVGQATIFCGGSPADTTMPDGLYSCDIRNLSAPIVIRPEKLINARNGVSTFDLVRIQQHILKLDTFTDPYQVIAANADGSDKISTIDMLHIQQVILKVSTSFPANTSWRFVPASHIFPYPSAPLAGIYPQEVALNSAGIDTSGLDFIGIKIGDVSMDSDPAEAAGLSGITLIPSVIQESSNDTHICIELNASSNEGWMALQGTLEFDAAAFELERVGAIEESGLVVNTAFAATGKIPFLWVDPSVKSGGQSLERQPLIRLHFKTRQSQPYGIPQLSISQFPTESFAINGLGERRILEMGQYPILTTSEKTTKQPLDISCFPNPFSTSLTLQIKDMTRHQEAFLKIVDCSGRIIYSGAHQISPPQTQITIPAESMSTPGVYFVEVITEAGVDVLRAIRK